MKPYSRFIIWSTLIFLLINLSSYFEELSATTVPDKDSSEITRQGFRNIYLGMTKAEVESAVKEDASILPGWWGEFLEIYLRNPVLAEIYSKTASRRAKTEIGPYRVDISFLYDNHGILYRIALIPPMRSADKITTEIQRQVDFFYGVFLERFGEPTYIRRGSKKINILDFKYGYHVFVYQWVKDNVERVISLRTRDFEYGIVISIVDENLEEIKEREDEERRKREQREASDDF